MDQGPPPSLTLPRMTRDAYRAWSADQPRRYELLDGVPIRMNAERLGHSRVKRNVLFAFHASIRDLGLPCEAIGDGFTVEIGEDTDFEPDAMVNCGERMASSALAAANPVIVVEVLSRSTRSIDVRTKFGKYFQVPSIRHYLVVEVDRRRVVHHRRDGAQIASDRIESGAVVCDPPGLSITLDDIYEGVTG